MKSAIVKKVMTLSLAATLALSPISASASVKVGSQGGDVRTIQTTLRDLGYYDYSKITGYFGKVTETAVRAFQKDNGLEQDGVVGRLTRNILFGNVTAISSSTSTLTKSNDVIKAGALDWFKEVQYIWDRGEDALVTDVDTGRSFHLRRTYGTNHADVEPLTKNDASIIKDIWGGWTWTRRAVVVEVDGYVIAGSLSAMPHAGVDSAPAESYVSGRSGGYGRGTNLDAVKNNGVSGVMDLHFKNSRNHNTNRIKEAHQIMVEKARVYIEKMGY